MTAVEAINLVKLFEDTKAVDGVNLLAKDGEFITILGPSGCGKSTTLRLIAGLLTPDEGKIFFDGKDVTNLPPNKRNVGFVFQRVALFPHMSVSKNIAFGLRARGIPKSEHRRRIKEVLQLVHMEGFEDRLPSQLSGGQAQRVEIARVLAPEPDILLFDEPLSNIDAKLRDELKYEIRRIQKETKKTMIYVTHDQSEAFTMSDRIYVMNNGRIEQVGTPLDLYNRPATPFVASFIGSSNFVKGKLRKIDQENAVLETEAGDIKVRGFDPTIKEGDAMALIRPEDIKIIQPSDVGAHLNVLDGRVEEAIFIGNTVRLNVNVNGLLIKADVYGEDRYMCLGLKDKNVKIAVDKIAIITA
ncbi:Spermidine/putrescine import ATP-binding protein PotA [archaeon HR01]|nr:Spermidine/putrescine import ATP-binding protein PotA [archaeon HR01]